MERLPVEILYKICAHLDKNDQLNCIRVCHCWKIIMEEYIFYRLVCIYSDSSLCELTRLVIKYPRIAHRIEQLVLFFGFRRSTLIDISDLLSLLSNARAIVCLDEANAKIWVDLTKSYPFHKHIQCISEPSTSLITLCLLSQGTCPRLTTLKLRGLPSGKIELLKYAPALKTLEICNGTNFFHHLNCIHRHAPGIVSLKLHHLTVTNVTLDEFIDPAIAITEFGFTEFNINSGVSGLILFEYMYRKYPNLSQFIYQVDGFYLQNYTFQYLDGFLWTPLIQNLGPQLKKLGYIKVTDADIDIFSVMENYDVQLDHLSLHEFKQPVLQRLAQSTQRFCLQSLELDCQTNISFDWLSQLPMLKRLKWVTASYIHIDLTEIIANAPLTLRSLHIVYGVLVENPDCLKVSNIEVLFLYGVQVDIESDIYFSYHFPKLTSLTLKNCRPNIIRIDLSGIQLYEFCVHGLEYFLGDYTVRISTEKGGRVETKFYSVEGQSYDLTNLDERIFPSPEVLPQDTTADTTASVTLICSSVERIVLT